MFYVMQGLRVNFKFARKLSYALLFIYAHSHAMNEQLLEGGAPEEQEEVRRGCCSRVWQHIRSIRCCSPERRTAAKQAVVLGGLMQLGGMGIFSGSKNPAEAAAISSCISVPFTLLAYRLAPRPEKEYARTMVMQTGFLSSWIGSSLGAAYGNDVALAWGIGFGIGGIWLGHKASKYLEPDEQQLARAQGPADLEQAVV